MAMMTTTIDVCLPEDASKIRVYNSEEGYGVQYVSEGKERERSLGDTPLPPGFKVFKMPGIRLVIIYGDSHE